MNRTRHINGVGSVVSLRGVAILGHLYFVIRLQGDCRVGVHAIHTPIAADESYACRMCREMAANFGAGKVLYVNRSNRTLRRASSQRAGDEQKSDEELHTIFKFKLEGKLAESPTIVFHRRRSGLMVMQLAWRTHGIGFPFPQQERTVILPTDNSRTLPHVVRPFISPIKRAGLP